LFFPVDPSPSALLRRCIAEHPFTRLLWSTIRPTAWLQGHIQNGEIDHLQATVRIGFRVEGQDDKIA